MLELGFTDFKMQLNHRQLLTSILTDVGIPEPLHVSALVALDKLDKIGRDAVSAELATRGVGAQSAESLLAVMEHGRGEPGTSVGFGPNFDEVGIAAFLARRQSLSSRAERPLPVVSSWT